MTRAMNSVEPPATSSAEAVPAVDALDVQPLLARLCDTSQGVVYFPVRHHSPMAAALVEQLIRDTRPAAVLIEGPSDYNDQLDELRLDHQLPIAIYSYFQTTAGQTSGAYYPFCDYSPEWSALRAASMVGAAARFIDLPWTAMVGADLATHRYADAELRRGRYVQMLCARLEVEDFDDLWDKIVESREHMTLADYLTRVHALCVHIRLWEEKAGFSDQRREAFMAEQIRQAQAAGGRILVVTGGFHSGALAGRLEGLACPGLDLTEPQPAETPVEDTTFRVTGIALTSYSYERLDGLTGYNAGMPSPGFYDHAWQQRRRGEPFAHQPLLAELVRELRQRRQVLSTADLVAVETSARALAALRGRGHVWRRDLVDAVTSALIKDELEYGCASPFVDAVHAILRGQRRGRLAAGTRLPPLVLDIQKQLADAGLEPKRASQDVELDLLQAPDLAKSRLLHRLRLLRIAGIERTGGTDFLKRDDLKRLWETWRLRWSPDFDSSCVEASRYGISLEDAAASRLQEAAREHSRSASAAAVLLVQAAQAGLETFSRELLGQLRTLIEQESEFREAAMALGHVLFLYCFDEAFGTTRRPELEPLLRVALERSLWLLEMIGRTTPGDRDILDGMRNLLEAYQRAAEPLGIDPGEFVPVMQRVEADAHKPPQVRGAAAGILWTLGAANSDRVVADLMLFTEPNDLGDFLAGLFAAAREVAQRHPPLVRAIDRLLLEFAADEFQQALPPLRLAFTYFTPREKHYMLTTLFESLGIKPSRTLGEVTVDAATAAEALAIDERVTEALRSHGLDRLM
jgi:hypothetical protein